MSLLEGSDKLVFVGFLVLTMLSLGLRTEWQDLRALLGHRMAITRALLVNFVFAPLMALGIVRLFPMPPGSAEALLILACVPGGPSSVHFTSKVKGEEAVAGAVVVLLSALAVVFSPLLVRWVVPGEWDGSVPYLRVVGLYAALLLAPLAAGMMLADRWPAAGAKLSRVLGTIGALLFVTFMLTTKSYRKEAAATVGLAPVAAMLLFTLLMLAAGWLLGGRIEGRRRILASASSMRNAALALAIARDSSGAGAVLMPALVAFTLVMVPPNTLFNLWQGLRAKRAATAQA